MQFPNVLFDEGEDFTIEMTLNCPVTIRTLPSLLLGVWSDSVDGLSGSSWGLWTDQSGKIFFKIVDTDKRVYRSVPRGGLFSATDLHIAVVRLNGVISIYLNGTFATSFEFNGASAKSDKDVTTTWNSYPVVGRILNIRITKSKGLYNQHFTPPPVVPYVRNSYTENVENAIAAQYGFRQNSLIDEAGNGVGRIFGNASMRGGRVLTPNDTESYFKLPCKKFGAADFTIECTAHITEVAAEHGTVIIGHWKSEGSASDENRWAILLAPDLSLSFIRARSDGANDSLSVTSEAGVFEFGRPQHIVVENVDDVLSIYVQGRKVAEASETLPIRGEAPFFVRSLSTQKIYSHAGSVWNIRIADYALYGGQISEKATFPVLANTVPSDVLVPDDNTSIQVTVLEFTNTAPYSGSTPAPEGYGSKNSSFSKYVDGKVVSNKTVKNSITYAYNLMQFIGDSKKVSGIWFTVNSGLYQNNGGPYLFLARINTNDDIVWQRTVKPANGMYFTSGFIGLHDGSSTPVLIALGRGAVSNRPGLLKIDAATGNNLALKAVQFFPSSVSTNTVVNAKFVGSYGSDFIVVHGYRDANTGHYYASLAQFTSAFTLVRNTVLTLTADIFAIANSQTPSAIQVGSVVHAAVQKADTETASQLTLIALNVETNSLYRLSVTLSPNHTGTSFYGLSLFYTGEYYILQMAYKEGAVTKYVLIAYAGLADVGVSTPLWAKNVNRTAYRFRSTEAGLEVVLTNSIIVLPKDVASFQGTVNVNATSQFIVVDYDGEVSTSTPGNINRASAAVTIESISHTIGAASLSIEESDTPASLEIKQVTFE